MEGIHGVDVSWLHHSPKGTICRHTRLGLPMPGLKPLRQTSMLTSVADRNSQKVVTRTSEANGSPSQRIKPAAPEDQPDTPPRANGTAPHQHHAHLPRPSILHRAASDKSEKTDISPNGPQSQKDQKPAAPGRKSSWVASISSKFSSSKVSGGASADVSTSQPSKGAKSPPLEQPNPFGAAVSPGQKDEKLSRQVPWLFAKRNAKIFYKWWQFAWKIRWHWVRVC